MKMVWYFFSTANRIFYANKHFPKKNSACNSMQGFFGKNVYHRFSIYEICMISIFSLIFFQENLKKEFFVSLNELDSFSDSVRSSWPILFLFLTKKNHHTISILWKKFFFSSANRILYANKQFPKKKFHMQNLFNLKHNPNLNPNPNPYNSMQGFHRKKVHHSFSIYEICMTSILNLIFFFRKTFKKNFFCRF